MTKAIIPIRLKNLLDVQKRNIPLNKTMLVMIYDYVLKRTNTYHRVIDFERDFEGLVFLNVSKWAKKFGVGNKTVYRMIDKLVSEELIEKVEVKKWNRKYNKYRLINIPMVNMVDFEIENINEIIGMETLIEKRVADAIKGLRINVENTLKYLKKELSQKKSKFEEYIRKMEPEIYSVRQNNRNTRVEGRERNPNDMYSYRCQLPLFPPSPLKRSVHYFENFKKTPHDELSLFFIESSSYLNTHTSWLNFKIDGYRKDNNIGAAELSNPYRVITSYEEKLIDLRHDLGSLLYSVNSFFKFYYQQYSISRSDSNRRIRHNVVEMPKEIRRFLYHPDFDILELDLANSQPSILVGMMKNMGVSFEGSLVDSVRLGSFYHDLRVASGLNNLEYDVLKIACLRFLYTAAKTTMKELNNKVPSIAKGFYKLYPKAFDWIVQRKRMFDAVDRKNNRRRTICSKHSFNCFYGRSGFRKLYGKP